MIELLEQGELEPTAQQVADRAGVSLRTVFHHFQSMETVFTECWTVQVQRHWADLRAVPGDGPLAERIDATVAQRADLFERIAGPRRAAVVWSHRSPVLARGLDGSHRTLRSFLAETFAPELATDPNPEVLLDALDAGSSFEVWDLLRRGRSRPPAVAALTRSLHALLSPTPPVQEDTTP
jgi:TetR/AcrR family transcriptional regulator, regulator of autoinduction and epiphytic fitness